MEIHDTGMNVMETAVHKSDNNFKWVRCPYCACTIQYETTNIHRQEVQCPVCNHIFIINHECDDEILK